VHPHFEARRHHAERIVHAGLLVEDEFLGQQVEDFAICRQLYGSRFLDGLADFVAGNLAWTRAKRDSAVGVQAAHVGSGNSDQRVLDSCSRRIFRAFDRFLNRRNGFLQINNDALTRSPRLSHAVAAITQAVIRDLRHQSTGLGASDIDDVDEIPLLVRHAYGWSCGS